MKANSQFSDRLGSRVRKRDFLTHSAANSPEPKKVRDYSRGNLDGVLKFSTQAKGALDRHVNQVIFKNSIPQLTPRDMKNL